MPEYNNPAPRKVKLEITHPPIGKIQFKAYLIFLMKFKNEEKK
jgi:hypothetical protein